MSREYQNIDRNDIYQNAPLFVISATLVWFNASVSPLMSAGIVQIILVPFLCIHWVASSQTSKSKISAYIAIQSFVILVIAATAIMSFLVNEKDKFTASSLLFSYIIPSFIYLYLAKMTLKIEIIGIIVTIYIIFSIIPLTIGIMYFYREWGIPTPTELLMARYNISRMDSYMKVTFGNTSGTSAILSLIIPMCVMYIIHWPEQNKARIFPILLLIVGIINAAIVQSRTLFATLASLLIIILLRRGRRAVFISICLGLVLSGALAITAHTPGALSLLMNRMTTAITLNSIADNSVNERLDSIRHGWKLLEDNWQFGIGPGQANRQNPWAAAHQLIINQGSELGIIGLLMWIVFSVIFLSRFLYTYIFLKSNDTRCVIESGPAFYLIYGLLGNAPLGHTTVNAWIGSAMLFLGIAASDVGEVVELPKSRRYGTKSKMEQRG